MALLFPENDAKRCVKRQQMRWTERDHCRRSATAGEEGPTLYVSGDQSDRASVLRTFGLDLRQIDGPIGAAAALKISYAGINKGIMGLYAHGILLPQNV